MKAWSSARRNGPRWAAVGTVENMTTRETEQRPTYQARRVPCPVPYDRCTVCGDKIKDDEQSEVTGFDDGKPRYLEACCIEYFVHGHPDTGHPIGELEFEDGTVERFDPDFHESDRGKGLDDHAVVVTDYQQWSEQESERIKADVQARLEKAMRPFAQDVVDDGAAKNLRVVCGQIARKYRAKEGLDAQVEVKAVDDKTGDVTFAVTVPRWLAGMMTTTDQGED